MTRHRKRKLGSRLKSFYLWHRYVGVASALFVVILSITGIALNHTERLRLDERAAGWSWLLQWYGIEAPTAHSFQAGSASATFMDGMLYVGGRPAVRMQGAPVGVVATTDLLVAATSAEIALLTLAGDLVERQPAPSVPAAIGRDHQDGVVLQTDDGPYRAGVDFMGWEKIALAGPDTEWARESELREQDRRVIEADYLKGALDLERVMLDLHSGRFFGPIGPWLMDAAAVLLLFLAVTGTWMWLRRRG